MLQWERIPPRYQYLLAVVAIKLKRLRQFAMTVDEVNDFVPTNLPAPFPIQIPAGSGQCRLLHAEVKIPAASNQLHVELLCEVHIEVMSNPVYRAHVLVEVASTPRFNKRALHIDLGHPQVEDITLIHDEYSLLRDGKSLLQTLLPSTLSGALELGVKTLGLVGGRNYQDLQQYLSLYLGGNKQKVLDYHKADIQSQIERLTENGELHYRLDEEVMEEKLFARYGERIDIENGQVLFKLSPNPSIT